MKTKELFLKDPLTWKLVNEGVSSNNTEDLDTLRFELESFVCDGEYLNGMRRILQGYRDSFKSPEQKAAWISGFYGSGKSHLAKVLRYLWINFAFPDGTTARSMAHLPEEITDLLTEISTLGKRHDGLHMAGGTLKAGAGSVRLRVMGLFFKSVGLPEGYPYAKFLIHLKRDGKFAAFKNAIEDQGKNFDQELGRFYTSGAVAKAYVQCYDHLKDPSQVGALLRADYPNVDDVSMDEMCDVVREAISAQWQTALHPAGARRNSAIHWAGRANRARRPGSHRGAQQRDGRTPDDRWHRPERPQRHAEPPASDGPFHDQDSPQRQ